MPGSLRCRGPMYMCDRVPRARGLYEESEGGLGVARGVGAVCAGGSVCFCLHVCASLSRSASRSGSVQLYPFLSLCVCEDTLPPWHISPSCIHSAGRAREVPAEGSCNLKEAQAFPVLFMVENPSSSPRAPPPPRWPWILDKGPASRPRRWMGQRVQLSRAQSQRKLTGQLALSCWVPSGLRSLAAQLSRNRTPRTRTEPREAEKAGAAVRGECTGAHVTGHRLCAYICVSACMRVCLALSLTGSPGGWGREFQHL